MTPLCTAAQLGHTAVIQALVRGGAAVDNEAHDGITALTTAVANGHAAAVKALLAAGAAVDHRARDDLAPLHHAANGGHVFVVKRLLRRGASVDLAGRDAATPLLYVAREGHDLVVEALLVAGAGIDVLRRDAATPLAATVVVQGNLRVVRLLLAAGTDARKFADALKGRNDGTMPSDIAAEMGELAALLDIPPDVDNGDLIDEFIATCLSAFTPLLAAMACATAFGRRRRPRLAGSAALALWSLLLLFDVGLLLPRALAGERWGHLVTTFFGVVNVLIANATLALLRVPRRWDRRKQMALVMLGPAPLTIPLFTALTMIGALLIGRQLSWYEEGILLPLITFAVVAAGVEASARYWPCDDDAAAPDAPQPPAWRRRPQGKAKARMSAPVKGPRQRRRAPQAADEDDAAEPPAAARRATTKLASLSRTTTTTTSPASTR
ncbi:ankyrin repeat-containing domain protein [Pelagophyceae sp. CCMP2097]|nr:ankyrin repeat-containing domain protein [Pelagophyceae sp. CCMP2097]